MHNPHQLMQGYSEYFVNKKYPATALETCSDQDYYLIQSQIRTKQDAFGSIRN